ncbi:glycosyltransferase family 2 protein [Pseudoalteromonas prydzensis]|uniref:glycosyltransferase family 2 protein n=1 Tax=Pseudoalteromonas prydzensis TaxID=182141 RepID=UPI0024BC1ECC|nr:glycosyltransferase family 2 protein [Pseudoalteromonas prydzensis]
MESICVLMSTYNGEKYVEEQVLSIMNQVINIDLKLVIRDDGSKDDTLKILNQLEVKFGDKIRVVKEVNIGVVGSFLELVASNPGYSYYAFCDQDDIWHPLKLQAAIIKLSKEKHKPAAYCSSYYCVDSRLKLISKVQITNFDDVNNLLCENYAPGCTVVFNSYLYSHIKDVDCKSLIMHDWYVLILASLFGSVILDDNAYLYYRQHDNNVVGAETSAIKRFKRKFITIWKNKEKKSLSHQLEYITLIKGIEPNISDEIKRFISPNNGFFSRLVLVWKCPFYRVSKFDDFIFKVLYISGFYKLKT